MRAPLRVAVFALALMSGRTAFDRTLAATAAKPASPAVQSPKKVVVFPEYQELLNKHLWTVSEPGEPLETRFNYEYWHDQKGRAERAKRIRDEFMAVDPRALDLANRRAWAINFYNYLVLEQATEHLLIPGKVRQRFLTVQDIRVDGLEFFQFPVVTIDSVSYTLDRFENHFLFDDVDRRSGNPPPATLDPRIHFALVCAAIGCPPLQPRAYRADSLEQQLNQAVRKALEHPAHFKHEAGSPAVQISTLFTWYMADFGGSREAAVKWLLPYLSRARRLEMSKVMDRLTVFPIVWDWKLNQVVGWRFHWEMDRGVGKGAAKKDSS